MKTKLKIRSSSFEESKKNYVAWGAYHLIAFRIIVASLYQKYFCGMTSPTLETALLSARCIYWLLFRKKKPKQSLCSRLYRYPNRLKPFRMQMLIFQPPNILKTPLENRCRSLKKQRGFKRSLCACNKKASPIDFYFFVCYLRQLKFAKARAFAIHTESNFS